MENLGHQGNHKNPLPLLVSVLGYVQLYGEHERGGGSKDRTIQGFDNQGGSRLLPGIPPRPPSFQLLTEAQVGRSETSSARESGQAESGADNKALVGACQKAGGQ